MSISEGNSYIGELAFAHSGLEEFVSAEGLVSIGDNVFLECYSLDRVVLPASLEYIGSLENARFDELDDNGFMITKNVCTAVIHVVQGSYAEQYCKDNGISYQYRD